MQLALSINRVLKYHVFLLGKTPLMYAAQKGHLDIVEFLLNNEADVDAKDNYGKFIILYFIG